MAARPVVGRAPEFAALHQVLADAGAGEGGLVLVTGEAGIGKTALVTAALRETPLPCSTLWGTCRDDPGVPGLWPWVEVLRSGWDAGLLRGAEAHEIEVLIGIGGTPALTGPGGDCAPGPPGQLGPEGHDGQGLRRFPVFDAIARALRRATADQVLVVVLDDLHWADAGTLRLLRFLQPDLPRTRMLVIGAYRDDELDGDGPQSAVLSELAARSLVLPLHGLDLAGVAQLMGPGPTAPDVEAPDAGTVLLRTGGNPFLVQQLMRLPPGAAGLPAGVREVLGRRLARLPSECTRLLEVAAVSGREVGLGVVAHASGVPADQVARTLETAASAGVVECPDLLTVRFTHDLFREALCAGLDPGRRDDVHRRVADALEALLPPGTRGRAAEIARHRVLVGPALPGDVAGYLVAAAQEATASLAFEEAAEHLVVAARLAALAGDSGLRRRIVLHLGDARRRAGDLAPARDSYLEAARLAGDDASALARAALGLHEVGAATWTSHEEVMDLLRRALAARDRQDATTARLLAALARELAHGPGERGQAVPVSARAVALARRIADPAILAIGLQARHDALWAPGSARRRLDVLAEMQLVAAAAGDPVLGWESLFGRFVALLELGDPEAYSVFFRVVEATERLRQPHYRWLMQSRRAVLAMFAGRLDEAEALLAQVAETALRLGEPDGMNVVGDLTFQLASLRGTRRALIDSWAAVADAIPRVMLATMEALAALDAGEPEAGLAAVRPWVEASLEGVRGWQVLWNAAMIAEVAAAAGDEPLCRRLYDTLVPCAGDMVVTGGAVNVAGPVSLYLGILATALGLRSEGREYLENAIDASERLDARPWAARSRFELARLLRGRGEPGDADAARQLAGAAAAAAARMGMSGLAERARALLAATGDASRSGANAFTRQEEVWTLAFAGSVVRLPDAKGLRDIARLLATPGRDVPVTALLGDGAEADGAMGADVVLDEKAVESYRDRLRRLDAELEAADALGDAARSARAQSERDALLAGLTSARGLRGRPRRLGDARERARKAVTARIRDSLNRIQARHPALGDHLRRSIVTGTYCAYRPDTKIDWYL